ncbi:ABC1 family protein-like protein [Hapsidospora chrysogenum ATCC 11550]|uniref:ABC1 family protein-like protein n=1 Tax=Hapsidospora chrysogenum (strain ATCC 11550 / CBS 779.69 / DSM 880 / IAM 14645 / JCM 23072 / IMI 49137) TaxID=857340 RepID=A0A086T5V9_HAPC1|nr:ABC1 family protein-like protein [Hapsidospora chrysogenum ATCC 11550]
MNAVSLSALTIRAGTRSWTCSACRGQLTRGRPSGSFGIRAFATGRGYSHGPGGGRGRKQGSRRVLLYASSSTAAVGAATLAFSEEIKSGLESAERTGRVATALAVCINDYRTTLNSRDAVDDLKEKDEMLKACHKRCAERTLKVLEKNGGIFIKLGQHLSAMNYLLPSEWTTTFIPLQDQCPVSPFESIERMFQQDTKEDLWDYFSEFSEEPIGAASLAQVHIATIKETGRKVAVKVQHPELEAFAPLDLALTKFTFSTLKRFFPEYDLEWLSSEMEVSLPKELNFVEEAENARRMKDHFAKIPALPLVIPEVLWAKKRILVMARESGRRLDDLEYLDANGIDRDEISATLARIFNEMIFGDGAPLHCDPHGGNIAIRKNDSRRAFGRGPNFDVILYDHGLYRDIPLPLRRSYAKMWLAVIDGDMDRMRKYSREVAGIEDKDFPLFASAITGRDYSVVSSEGSILKTRTSAEQQTMSGALQEGLIVDLVQLLSRVPRIILLILKTNDLTRSLDENLQTRQGPIRNFMILARYCTRTVFLEKLDEIRARGSLLWPPNAARVLAAWIGYLRVEVKLEAFELWLGVKRVLGLKSMAFGEGALARS